MKLKIKYIKLILTIFLTCYNINILIGQNLVNEDKNIFKIEINDAYTCLDLTHRFIDLNNSLSALNDSLMKLNKMSNPLLRILILNFDDQFMIKSSVYQGFVLTSDTLKLIQLLNQNSFISEGFTYEWKQLKDSILGLIIHKKNERKIEINISEIKYIKIIKNNELLKVDYENYKDSENIILIELNDNVLNKIKALNQKGDLYIRINLCNRTFILSMLYEKIKKGIYIMDNISDSFANELRSKFNSIIKPD
jgi:hypothetical protein